MTTHVVRTAERIVAVDWRGSFDHRRSRAYLMKEYLRRAARWVQATGATTWSWPDIAAAIDPAVRADPAVVERTREHVLDASVRLPDAPADPFEGVAYQTVEDNLRHDPVVALDPAVPDALD